MDGNVEKGAFSGSVENKSSVLGLEALSEKLGNKLFTPKEILGKDAGSIIKTPIIASRVGLNFFENNHDIVSKIDSVVAELTGEGKVLGQNSHVDLGDVHIKYLTSGISSDAFILETGGDKFVLKTKKKATQTRSAWQPYAREMLQAQTISRDLSSVLGREKVSFPDFLFASDEIVCTKLETGQQPREMSELSSVTNAAKKMREYMNKRRKSEDLWKDVFLDISISQNSFGDEVVQVLPRDVLRRANGSFVWLDPFVYGISTEPAPDTRSWLKKILSSRGKKYDYSG